MAYKLYTDKQETFECDLFLEGADLKNSSARIIVESNDLTLMFKGKIDKKGNINSSLKISALFGESSSDLENVNLLGNIDDLLKGPWDDYYDITVKLEKIL